MKAYIAGLLAALLIFSGSAYALDSNYIGLGAALHRPLLADPFNWEAQVDALVAAGVKWVRIGADWRSFQPDSKDAWNQQLLSKFDLIVNALHENGIQMLFGLGYSPKWASTHPEEDKYYFYAPADMDAWENYITFLTNRYRGKITAWEIWNEPDYTSFWKSSVEEYYELLKSAYTVVKRTDPNNQVLIGGLTFAHDVDENNSFVAENSWFDRLLTMGGGAYFDIHNYHAYVDSRRMEQKYNCLMEVINSHPAEKTKKIWVTETGASSYMGADKENDEASKAEFLEQTYALHKRYDNIERVFIYTFTNPTNNTAKENNFGLATADGQPLDAYYHFQALGGARLDFNVQNTKWQTLTYDPGDVDGTAVRLTDGKLRLNAGASLGLQVNDQWLYDANGGIEERVYVDVDYPAGQAGAKWQIVYDGQADSQTASAVFNVPDDKAGTGTLLLEDIKLANRQDGDDLQLCAVGGAVTITGLTVRKETGRAVCVMGETDHFTMMQRSNETDATKNAYNPPANKGGSACRSIGDNKKGFYFRVANGIARPGDTHVTVTFEYFDEGTDMLAFGYNNPEKIINIRKTGTNTWKTANLELADADFAKNKSYGADFRITNANDGSMEYVRKVTVTSHLPYTIACGFEQVGANDVGVVRFQNQYADLPKKSTAVLGLYADDRLLNVQQQEITVPPGTLSHTALLHPQAVRQEGQHWKLFLWDSAMYPLAGPAIR